MQFWRVSSSTMVNVERGLASKTWGFSPRWEGRCRLIRKGDKIAIYTSATHSFIAICEVTKEHFVDSSPIWPDDIYPHRIGIEPLPMPQKSIELKQVRTLAKRPRLGDSFQPAIASLTPQDFNVILKLMTDKEAITT